MRRAPQALLYAVILLAGSALFPGFASGDEGFWGCLRQQAVKLFSLRAHGQFDWRKSAQIRKDADGGHSFLFRSSQGERWIPVVGWSAEGNPLIRVNSREIRFEPTQGTLDRIDSYGGPYARGTSMERLTAREPLMASYYPGPDHPQFIFLDGHHRYYYAQRDGENVYVEVLGIADSYESSGEDWSQLPFKRTDELTY
jgi:hypothetical protein